MALSFPKRERQSSLTQILTPFNFYLLYNLAQNCENWKRHNCKKLWIRVTFQPCSQNLSLGSWAELSTEFNLHSTGANGEVPGTRLVAFSWPNIISLDICTDNKLMWDMIMNWVSSLYSLLNEKSSLKESVFIFQLHYQARKSKKVSQLKVNSFEIGKMWSMASQWLLLDRLSVNSELFCNWQY